MKLNARQLRKLIKESIETREPGSPLWQFNESPGNTRRGPRADNVDLGLSNFVEDVVRQEWQDIYEPGDPSIKSPEEWNDQVDAALQDLHDKLQSDIREIEEKLINGEFY